MKAEYDGASAAEKQNMIKALNECNDGLGDAFAQSEIDFEGAGTDITNVGTFFQNLKKAGFD